LNRLHRGPATELPTSLFRAPPGIDSRRLSSRCHLELTAVSAIVFFLGLLFGFQRPSHLSTEPLVAVAASCYLPSTSRPLPIQPRSRLLYFEAAFLSSGRFPPTTSPHLDSRFASSCRGARNLLRFRLPCQLASSTLSSASPRLPPLRGAAASTTAASRVNFARRLRISSFTSSSGASVASATSPFRPRGAASIASPWMESTAHFSRLIPLAVRFFQQH
jgi:hypothetical protein